MAFGHLLAAADFEKTLAVAPRSRSVHFAAHHFAVAVHTPSATLKSALADKLSTGVAPDFLHSVDNLSESHRLGCVLPKRHARRAVTRNLLRRQIRAAVELAGSTLAPGLWVIRLKAPFDRKQFPSAKSTALRDVARAELKLLLQRAIKPGPAR
jgi:ribonuclease P protein component